MQIVDSLALAAIVHELEGQLRDARLEKIHLPTATEMVWQLRGRGQAQRLYFSVRHPYTRVHLTSRRFSNPATPPNFCMLLRKHLEGSRILRVEQWQLERVLQIVTTGRDELGDPIERALVAEVTGKHANWILLDRPWGTVLGCLRPVSEAISRARQILPGLPYDPPPLSEGKVDPRQLEPDQLMALLAAGGTLERALLGGVHSLGRTAIAQFAEAAGLSPDQAADQLDSEALSRLIEVWSRAMRAVELGSFSPHRVTGKSWDYQVLGDSGVEPQGLSELWDAYYGDRELFERFGARRHVLETAVNEKLEKIQQREGALEQAVREAEQAETFRQWGELIQAYGYGLAERSAELVAENYHLPGSPPVAIALDPRLTPQANAQRYFRKYQKARTALEVHRRMHAEARREREYWHSVQASLYLAETPEDLAAIQAELQPPSGSRQPTAPEGQPLCLRSGDGLEIRVGRNNRQNEQVTLRWARPEDWWFHAQNLPGAHVVVRTPSGELPEGTRDEAAMLAAYYSQARESANVPVIYTQRRHVKKIAGGKPGLVQYEREKTLFVTPQAAQVRGMLPMA